MREINSMMETALNPFCALHNITSLQLNILLWLYAEGPQTVSGLAKRSCMAGANNSALCKRLEKDGYVYRKRAAEDERHVLISLAPAGMALIEAFKGYCEQKAEKKTSFTDKDRTAVEQGLEKLMQMVTAYAEETKNGQ